MRGMEVMVDIWQNPFWTAAILFMQISRLKLPIWNVYQTEIITVHVPEQHGTIKVRSPLMVPMTTSGPRTICQVQIFDLSVPSEGTTLLWYQPVQIYLL